MFETSEVSQCFYCLWTTMCCTRCLQILICIAVVLISTNGMDVGLDSLSNVNKMKQHELGMEEDPHEGLREELDRDDWDSDLYNWKHRHHKLGAKPGLDLLVGKVGKGKVENPIKTLHYENVVKSESKTTKCTTNQPIQVDVNAEMKNSEEATPNPEDITIITTNEDTIIPDDVPANETVINGSGEGETGTDITGNTVDDITNTLMTLFTKASDENKVDPFNGEKDPSRDDEYDATVSTKKYYGPHASYFPDHYLDDA